ncbi:hypothetical protein HMI55_006914 [Coelomomyces lativittatus]|nr:hypothetical protein HMI55_006914 [Coelomomyces lativittatus]
MTHTSSDASSLHLPLLPSYLTLSPFRSQFTFFTPTHTSSSSSSSFTPPHVVFSTPTFSTSSSSSSSSSSSFPNESYLFNASSTTTPSSLPPCSSKRTSSSSSSSSPLSSTFLAFLPPEEDLDEPGRVGWPPSSSSSSSSSVGSFPGRKRRVGQGVFPPPWPPQPAPPLYPLPSQWSSEDKCTLLDLHPNGWTVEYIGPGRTDTDAASIRANHSIPCQTGVYYFELEILSKGRDGYIGIGVCGPEVPLNRLPGRSDVY